MKKSVWREQGRQVREEAFIQGVCQRDGEGKEVEERVGARAGEDLDAALHLEDLSHGRVAGRDDPAFGIAVGGFPAGELGHDDVLDAGGVDREGEPPGDVLDQVLVGVNQEGDRLRRFRALLPCEVVVVAVTHPLHGCRLRAYAFRHVDGVPHLKVELPDGLPGLVAVEAVDVPGSEQAVAGAGLILDGAGLRGLHAVVMRLRERDAPGGRR